VLKGRSSSPEIVKEIQEFLLIKHLNMTPVSIKRLPYEDKIKYTILINEMMATSPQLLGIGALG